MKKNTHRHCEVIGFHMLSILFLFRVLHFHFNLPKKSLFYSGDFSTRLTPDGFPAVVWGLAEPSKFSHLSFIKVKEIQGSLTPQMVALALTTMVQEFFGAD